MALGHGLIQDPRSADPQHQRQAEPTGEIHSGRVNRPSPHDAESALAKLFGLFAESSIFVLLPAEGLDLADALEVVHQLGVHGAGGPSLASIATVRRGRVPERAADKQGQGDERKPSQCRIGN